MRPRLVLALASLILPALVAGSSLLAVSPARAHSPGVLYSHASSGWQKFLADNLRPLVEGEGFTYEGREYAITRLHAIRAQQVTRWTPSHERADAPHRAWFAAVVHLTVDGRLTRARIEGTARYLSADGTWEWDRVQMYLGENTSYDFVSGEMK